MYIYIYIENNKLMRRGVFFADLLPRTRCLLGVRPVMPVRSL